MNARSRRGVALVLVVLLLGSLLVVVYALAALTRIDDQLAASAIRRTQARQNALLAIATAVGELQATAGRDDVVTGIAGVAGVPGGAGNPARHWCGVWSADGAHVAWLVSGGSGAVAALPQPEDAVTIVGSGTLGADGVDREHVRVGRVEIESADGPPGRIAWWVGDEGVKLSAVIAEAEAPAPGGRQAVDELIPALSPTETALERVTTYGQLALVPSGGVTEGMLAATFHSVTVTHRGVEPGAGVSRAGKLNVNSSSMRFWRGIAATYDRAVPAEERLGLAPEVFAARWLGGIGAGGPFVSVAEFAASPRLAHALAGSGVEPAAFAAVLAPWLTVRSDTFLVRGYGDVLDPVDRVRVESAAWCEATVQRTDEPLPGHGRRFRLVRFRWMGPDEI